ncbi:N-acetyl-gamma-glutamyl-phosphate reductase [Tepidibacter hydrothermalis]|uniref:N-acetyl-gamma-glutamyl-phosphate reductase n=1 Tax=Tepidibacter hydrothermalis TaxID=3036126 RepID=A0ABY8E6Y4_9FIRM|nr:N-acetyl-gamma-glutamyl-phosphate reductase [Tepidibacter hydrothermalis]WFD08643.1 N-acetyl-gamma-glutamyl-phosphate reductase [Tepidibacter hydrothermalis]
MIKAGVIGSTGYAGQQLVWFLNNHPDVKINFLSSHSYSGVSFSKIYGNYSKSIESICVDIKEAESKLSEIDILFIALPHGKSFNLVKKALNLGVKVIDLGADFRLKDPDIYKQWYALDHQAINLLPKSIYGLPELNRKIIKESNLIANPGCYPTASILALTPLLKSNIIDPFSIIIDAKSGVSGAGRSLNTSILYGECNESIKAYSVSSHRHTPEIEQVLSQINSENISLLFTPHLVPMNRGILTTCYGNLVKDISQEELYKIYSSFYKDESFVRVIEEIPETKWVKGSNFCDIAIRVDERTKKVIIVSAIDNLIKGAAGQAVQNMNIMFNLDENKGLDLLSMFP